MAHRLHELLEPEPPHDPARSMREALALFDEALEVERLRLRRAGVPAEEIPARLAAWQAEEPPLGATWTCCRWTRFPG